MNADKWTNTQSLLQIGNNSVLGTPRSWINRAVGCKYQDLNQQATSLTPGRITVAGVWFRPCVLPDTGDLPAIYRFFALDPKFCGRGTGTNLQPVIGMGVAVPADDIYQWRQRIERSGAVWTWWSWPDASAECVMITDGGRRQLDHQRLYDLFNTGLTVREVAAQLGIGVNAIHYVYKKWQAGLPADKTAGRRGVDHASIAEDLRTGEFTMTEIAVRNKTTRATVWKVKRKENITV